MPARVAAFFDDVAALGVEGITVSPGYAYERAPDQQHFLNRDRPRTCSATFSRGKGGKAWPFFQSTLFLDFLAGNRTYHCTPWGNPTRTVFGWQRPCYLLGEGYAATFKELMEATDLGLATAPAITRNAPIAWCIAASRRPPSTRPSTIRLRALEVAVAKHPHAGSDGPRHPARRAATRRISSSAGTSSTSSPKSVKPRIRRRAPLGCGITRRKPPAHPRRSAATRGSGAVTQNDAATNAPNASAPPGRIATSAACGSSPVAGIGDDPQRRKRYFAGGSTRAAMSHPYRRHPPPFSDATRALRRGRRQAHRPRRGRPPARRPAPRSAHRPAGIAVIRAPSSTMIERATSIEPGARPGASPPATPKLMMADGVLATALPGPAQPAASPPPDSVNPRPGDEPRLRLKAGNGDHRRGAHIPTGVDCRLPFLRLR